MELVKTGLEIAKGREVEAMAGWVRIKEKRTMTRTGTIRSHQLKLRGNE